MFEQGRDVIPLALPASHSANSFQEDRGELQELNLTFDRLRKCVLIYFKEQPQNSCVWHHIEHEGVHL